MFLCVLGAPKLDDFTPGPDLRQRLDRAVELYRLHPGTKILVTGGSPNTYGSKGKRAEGLVMRDFLIEHGVSSDDVLVEDKANGTFTNATNSLRVLKASSWPMPAHVVLITHDWHAARARLCFDNAFKDEPTTFSVDEIASDRDDATVVERIALEVQHLDHLRKRLGADGGLPPIKFKTRMATRADAQRVFDLVNDAYLIETGDTGVAFKKTNRFIAIDEAHRCIDNGLVLAVDNADNFLACACVTRDPERPTVADLGPLAVDRKLQGRGLGPRLIAEVVIPRARDELGCTTLEITVVNHRAGKTMHRSRA
jgi:GNAT superfamily N-acetyltransferase